MIAIMLMFCLAGNPAGVAEMEQQLPRLMAQYNTPGLAVVMLKRGEVAWSGYYGERRQSKPVTPGTLFNTGSIAKTVTAETVLRLVAMGKIRLDEPIADYYTHPHLKNDPRHRKLTPRFILSHQTGLLNWEYNYPDQRLAFVSDPGSRFTYSGAAYEMLAEFVAAKLGRPYDEIVREVVFEPLGLKAAVISRQSWLSEILAHPMDSQGQWMHPFTYTNTDVEKPVGRWSAADDLYITALDYVRFLAGVAAGEGLSPELARERLKITQSAETEGTWRCRSAAGDCPTSFGYGLGWTVFQYPDQTLVHHGGWDAGEHAQAYFDAKTGDGLVIFTNGGNGYQVALAVMDYLDKKQPLTRYFRPMIAHNQRK